MIPWLARQLPSHLIFRSSIISQLRCTVKKAFWAATLILACACVDMIAPVASLSAPTSNTSAQGAQPASSVSLPGYKVDASSNYAGTLTCLVSKEGMKVTSDRMGMTWIITSPSWNAQIFNSTTDCYMDVPYDEWIKRPSFAPMAKRKAVLKLEKTNNSKVIQGLKAKEFYIMTTAEVTPEIRKVLEAQSMAEQIKEIQAKGQSVKPGQVKQIQQKAAASVPKSQTYKEAEMWIANDPYVPKQFNELMGKIFGLPLDQGMPLSISLKQRNGKIVSIWETGKLTKTTISKSEFAPLTGYKKVKTEVEMMLGDDIGMGTGEDKYDRPAGAKRAKPDDMP